MNIAVFFGGKSCEHSISVATGVATANAIKDSGHNVIPIYVDRNGKWLTGKNFFNVDTFKVTARGSSVFLRPGDNRLRFSARLKKIKLDCAIICCHGRNGEDGTLQGLLTLSDVPFTGSDVASSAIGMDKELMKKLFRSDKLPILRFVTIKKGYDADTVTARIRRMGYPVIVKPARAGSSIGIGVAHDDKQLISALSAAFEWDVKVVVEKALVDFTEFNCAVIGSSSAREISMPETPLTHGEFLSYYDKYHDKTKCGSFRKFPADVSASVADELRSLSLKAYDCISADGVARVDLIRDNSTGKIYINEINTVPGSLAIYLFPEKTARELIFLFIDAAINRKSAEDSLNYVFADSVFAEKSYFLERK